MTSLRHRLPRRSLGFRLIALILVPVIFAAVLVAERLQNGIAKTNRVQQLESITAETLAIGRLQALLDLERSSVLGVVQGRTLPMGLAGLKELLGIDIASAQTELDGLVSSAATAYRAAAKPDREVLALLDGRTELVAGGSTAVIADVAILYGRLSQLLGDRGTKLDGQIMQLSTAGIGTEEETVALRDRLTESQAFNALVTSVGNQSYLLVQFLADPANFTDTTKLELAAAIVSEREAIDYLSSNADVQRVLLDEQSPTVREWREAQTAAIQKFGLAVAPPPDLNVIESARLVGTLGLAAARWLREATPVFAGLSQAVSTKVAELRDSSEQRSARELRLAALVGALAIVWVTFISWSLIRPLRKLTRRAAQMRDGEFGAKPIGPVGPSEIAALASTFDQLSHNLQLVAQQTEALGAGRLQDDVLQTSLPGSFGASMRRSIEQSAAMTERLAAQARCDSMTGLPNRKAALERLQEAINRTNRSGTAVALLFCDLDGFKVVNDTYGHSVGDEVLRVVATRLQEASRDVETVARLGGDEFVVIAEHFEDTADAAVFAQRLITAIEQPITIDGARFHLSCSVGVTMSTADATPTSLLGEADFAVYEAKRLGRARVMCFDASMQAVVDNRFEIESKLRQALIEGQFELYIQPIIGADSLMIESAEALLRWNRPGHGLVAPGDFIAIAEESWLIVDIGKFVINEACRLLSIWQAAGVEIPLAVNVAGRHLVDGNLVGDVQRALRSHNTAPHLFTIELTESQLVADIPRGAAVLSTLREIGVRVALDDFGAGYSSLTYLRQLPIDTMKIDRSFVKKLPDNGQSGSIVASLLHLAKSLRLSVVAEGVETAEQASFLSNLGCDRLQGYHFARPMPAGDFIAWAAHDLDRERA